MNEDIVLKNNSKHLKIYKEHHTLENTLNVVKTITQDLV